MLPLQREHRELLNRVEASGVASSSIATSMHGSLGGSQAEHVANNQQQPSDPRTSWQQMRDKLHSLKIRAQRVAPSHPADQLSSQAQTSQERLLLVKLQEASTIIQEQERVSLSNT